MKREHLYNYLVKCTIAALPEEQRMFYHYIQDVEFMYEEESQTPEQYFDLLTKNHPYLKAAQHFQLSVADARSLMMKLEQIIREEADARMERALWRDCTETARDVGQADNKQYYFFFS